MKTLNCEWRPAPALPTFFPVYVLGALLTLGLGGSLRAADPAAVYVTAKDTDQRLSAAGSLDFVPMDQPGEHVPCVFVDPTKTFQSLVGIGGALTDASAETYAKLPAEAQRELIEAYYDPVKGIGYSLGRTHINSCDFSSGSYTYVAEGDESLSTFSIAHDLKYRIPLIKAAIQASGGHLTLFASPWSPPAWMKSNNDMLHGGKLLPRYADAWARYYVKFVQAYAKEGVPIWGLTLQNEPMAVQKWESCVYTASDERDFVKNHLGPTLARSGLGAIKLMVWDHNRTMAYQQASTVLDDPEAAAYVWGVAYHWYVEDTFDNIRRVQEAYPATHVMLTEACLYPYATENLDQWHWGETYATSMIKDFNNGAVGWTDWNILLDQEGGPNHVNNFCFAPIHGDTRTGQLHRMNSYYYIGHFSKFIRPGAVRVIASPMVDSLSATAFKNTDGSLAVIVLNTTDKKIPYNLWIRGRAAATESPAHSIMTLVVPSQPPLGGS